MPDHTVGSGRTSAKSGREHSDEATPAHHLAAVVHHFLSDDRTQTARARAIPRLWVAGPDLPRLTQEVTAAIREVDLPVDAVDLGGASVDQADRSAETARVTAATGAESPCGTSLLWCLTDEAARSLAGARDLGRWSRCLRPEHVDILVVAAGEGDVDLETCRRRASLVATGVPVAVTRVEASRLPDVARSICRRAYRAGEDL